MFHVTLDPHMRHHHVLLQSTTGSHHPIFGNDWEAGLSCGGWEQKTHIWAWDGIT
jgi:hypothetical protein